MRHSESARVAPAIDSACDPHNELLPCKIEHTVRPFESGRRGGRVVIGVNLSMGGAVAVLTTGGKFVAVHDAPVLADAALLTEIVSKSHATKAFVEHVSARSGDGPTGAFAAENGVPVAFLTPPRWKRLVGITAGRDYAKDAAVDRRGGRGLDRARRRLRRHGRRLNRRAGA